MPYKILWLKSAQIDMDALFTFYSSKSIRAAVSIHNGIIDEADRLVDNPYMAPSNRR